MNSGHVNMCSEDKYISVLALLNVIINCNDNTDIEVMQQTARVAWVMLKDIEPNLATKSMQ